MASENPCMTCGACCAIYRVSFHWSEAEPSLGGNVPIELTETRDRHHLCMRGTNCRAPHCIALEGTVGGPVRCRIYPQRPSPCRDLNPFEADGRMNAQCLKARLAYGLPPLEADVEFTAE